MANSVFIIPGIGSFSPGGGFTPTGQILAQDGTVALPGVAWANEPSSGRYRISAGRVGESILGSLIYDWNATRILSTVPIYFPDGLVGSPAVTFGADTNLGLARLEGGVLSGVDAGAEQARLIDRSWSINSITIPSTSAFAFNSSAFSGASTPDVILIRDAANTLAQRNGTNAQAFRLYNTYTSASVYENLIFRWTGNVAQILTDHTGGSNRSIQISPANGLLVLDDNNSHGVLLNLLTDTKLRVRTRAGVDSASVEAASFANANTTNGQAITALQTLTELTTIAAAATTDTTIQMPANSVVLGVAVRVTTVIPTATNFTVGDSGSAARFSTAAVSSAAGSTDPGTKAGAYYNAVALSIRITPDAPPADNTGRVRVVIYYYTVTPPTS